MRVDFSNLAMVAYNAYLSVYKIWRDYDKQTYTDCLEDENRYTFADDMVVYMGDINELNKYIERMLDRHCNGDKQAYFEMILSTMTMANVFADWGADKESELCGKWYRKLFYREYTKYITEEEISDLWGLR